MALLVFKLDTFLVGAVRYTEVQGPSVLRLYLVPVFMRFSDFLARSKHIQVMSNGHARCESKSVYQCVCVHPCVLFKVLLITCLLGNPVLLNLIIAACGYICHCFGS